MKIGILGAMLEEVSSIKELMVISKETTIADRTYYEGKIKDTEVVLVFSRWGKVASACTTTTLINQFAVSFILFTGVAGAVDNQLNIGDIVIANGLYQHDMDARPFFDQFQIPLTPKIIFEPNPAAVETITLSAKQFINQLQTVFEQDLLEQFSIVQPTIHHGLIASGDKFITAPSSHDNLNFSNKTNKTLAVEMEGASVAQVCEEHNTPYLVVRVISDKANESAAIDFQSFISKVASKYSAGIVKEFCSVKNPFTS